MDVTEVLLPGVGLRYEFTTHEGDRLGVVARRSGDIEVLVYPAQDPDESRPVIRLNREEADTLAEILGAPRMAERFADLTKEVPGLSAGQVVVAPGSNGRRCGRSTGKIQCSPAAGSDNPAALAAFGTDLASPDALTVLAAAPSPEQGRRLSQARIETLLREAGRPRNLTVTAGKIKTALGTPQLGARPGVVPAYAASASALLAVLTAMAAQTEVLAGQVEQGFGRHPDAEIYRSQPGLGMILGARVLAEFGDDPHRYTDAKARKNYSGMSPITKASGIKRVVLARYARNRRLGDALFLQAYSALRSSPGARGFYDQHRARGATHYQALRALANRLVGILHGCLGAHSLYDETRAWHTAEQATLAA